jgi:ABC-type multidrug transport system fused ATPase/permease subunit
MTPAVYQAFSELRHERRLDTNRVFLYKETPIQRIGTAFKAACRRAGITNLRIHDFRHTASTNLRRAGVDTATAMKIVGHKSDRMHRRYNTIELEDLHTYYGHVAALKGVDLEVGDGEIVALLGSNGAGKSTLMMTICGNPRAREGAIEFGGRDITRLSTHDIARLKIEFVFPLNPKNLQNPGVCCPANPLRAENPGGDEIGSSRDEPFSPCDEDVKGGAGHRLSR